HGDDQPAAAARTRPYLAPDALAIIGAHPMLGRGFRPGESRPGNAAVVLLAARVWRGRYEADPAMVGSLVRINGVPMPVVGVMPDGFRFPDNADVWQPLDALDLPADARQLKVYGRLSAGATIA